MELHTTPGKVQELLGLKYGFENNTLPSLSAVTSWIQEVTAELNELTAHKYEEQVVTDILDYDGSDFLLTKYAPISDVTVSINTASRGQAPVWEELDLYKNYLIEEKKGKIMLTNFSGLRLTAFREGKQKFKVDYQAGMDEIPLWLTNLATRMVALKVMNSALNNRVINSEDASQIRVGQVQVIKPSDFGIGNYDVLKASVDKDLMDIANTIRGVRYVNY